MVWHRLDGAEARPLDEVTARWRRRSVVVYALMAVAGLVGGNVPLVHAALTIGVLVLVNAWLVRGALSWLTGPRQLFARITVKLWAALIACICLVLDVLLTPLPVVRALVLSVIGVVSLAAFVEGSLSIVRRRVAWEHEGLALGFREWGLPVGLLGLLIGGVLAGSALVVTVLYVIAHADVWGLSDIAKFLLGDAK